MKPEDLTANYEELSQLQRRVLREKYAAVQGGKCHHCGGLLSEEPPKEIKDLKIPWNLFPPNFLKYPVHLHHCHETGSTIGAVHALCNAVLWVYHGE